MEISDSLSETVLEWIYGNDSRSAFGQNTILKISEQVHQPKMKVSALLKDMMVAGQIVRIETRPLYFLSVRFLNEQGIYPERSSYQSLQEVINLKDDSRAKQKTSVESEGFSQLIGHDGSLKRAVSQTKAALSYPPRGLPVLFLGPTGTGKSRLAQEASQWARESGLISPSAGFVTVNCSEFANNPELLTANLFGYVKGAFTGADKDTPGLVAAADGGILFLDEVHNLKGECQEKLFLLMDKGIYHPVGENEKWKTASCRFLFATTEDPQQVLLKTMLRRIPMIINIPALNERPVAERVEIVRFLYAQEEKVLQKEIWISRAVFSLLSRSTIPGNIGGLKAAVQVSCINSLYEQSGNRLMIRLEHLPENILASCRISMTDPIREQDYIPLCQMLSTGISATRLITMLEDILSLLETSEKDGSFIQAAQEKLDTYFAQEQAVQVQNGQKSFYLHGLEEIFDAAESRFGFHIPDYKITQLASLLYTMFQEQEALQSWSLLHEDQLQDCLPILEKENYRLFHLASQVCVLIQERMECLNVSILLVLTQVLLHEDIQDPRLKGKACVIMAHGYSTASSIAQAANQLLEAYVFDAIDMPVFTTTEQLTEHLKAYIEHLGNMNQLYLLVDMGSLMEVGSQLGECPFDIGILNNISTMAALELGTLIRQEQPMEDILKTICTSNTCEYRLLRSIDRQKAIICTCASGIGTAARLKTVLENSIPSAANVKIFCTSYEELQTRGHAHNLFKECSVLGVVGSIVPSLPDVPVLGIEDLILNEGHEVLESWMDGLLSHEQQKQFRQALLVNFSLDNLMDQLTILNPSRLLEQVAGALDCLQNKLNQHWPAPLCFGLYIHISCMIERLLFAKSEEYPLADDFVKENAAFVNCFRTSFQSTELFYHIQIPDAEIRLIWQYVDQLGD